MVDEYQDTNRPQYLLIQRLAVAPPQPLRRRRPGSVDLQVARRRPAQHPRLRARLSRSDDRPLERNYRSTQVILDAASAVIAQNRNRKEKRLYTDRTGGARVLLLPRRRRPRRGRVHRAHVPRRAARRRREHGRRSSIAPTRSRARSKTRSAGPASPTRSSAASGSTSARKSRTRSPTCKLVLNPHDDVSLRRVINVPARGIGKGVMESLDGDRPRRTPTPTRRRCSPGCSRSSTANSLWARLVHAVEQRLLAPRAHGVAGGVPRSASSGWRRWRARGIGVDRARQGARPERLPAGSARGAQRGGGEPDREPDGARLGGARVRDAQPGAVARGLRRPAVAAVGRRRGSRARATRAC